jgi:hypothetical protein
MDDKTFDVYSDIPRDIFRLRKSAAAYGCEVEDHEGGIRVRNLPVRALTFRATDKVGKVGNPASYFHKGKNSDSAQS